MEFKRYVKNWFISKSGIDKKFYESLEEEDFDSLPVDINQYSNRSDNKDKSIIYDYIICFP
jgi:hypothetical protein